MPPLIEMSPSVPVFTVFIQGLVSFFSPCIFPLLPVYMGYLAGGTYTVAEDGSLVYPQVILNTAFVQDQLCFPLGQLWPV